MQYQSPSPVEQEETYLPTIFSSVLSSENTNLQTIMATIDAHYEGIGRKERHMHERMHYCIFQHIHVMNVSLSISLEMFLPQI
mgnify:CR=1 FL=1